jgi:hypothetical protein
MNNTPLNMLILVICLVLFIGLAIYTAYFSMTRPSKYQDHFIETYSRLPKWFPFRDHFISDFNSSAFVQFSRITYIFYSILGLVVLVFILLIIARVL